MISVRTVNGNPMTFVVSVSGRDVGQMQIGIVPIVHDLTVEKSLITRKIVEALFQYAKGFLKASGFDEAMMLVEEENIPMKAWVEEKGFRQEPKAQPYLTEIQ